MALRMKTWLQGLFFGLILVWSVPNPAFSTEYYLDSANPETGNGTLANPWQKIGSISNIGAGDSILFKRGGTWHESFIVPASGITVGAYGVGEAPLIDVSRSLTGGWASQGQGVYKRAWPVRPGVLLYRGQAKPAITTLYFPSVPAALAPGAILLQLDGVYTNLWVTSKTETSVSGITLFDIRPDKTMYVRQVEGGKEKQWSTPLGVPQVGVSPEGLNRPGHWYWQDGILYLYSDVDPSTIEVAVGEKSYGILAVGKTNLTLEDLAVRGANEVGVFLQNTIGSTFRNLQITGCGTSGHKTGLLLFNSSNNTIGQNIVDSVLSNGIAIYAEGGQSKANTLSGNRVINSGSAGISLGSGGDASSVTGNLIEGNTVTGANAISYDSAGIYTLMAGSNTIRANIIDNCGSETLRSAGIMVDGGTLPLTIDANTLRYNSTGGIAVSNPGHKIVNNTAMYNGVPSWTSGQIVFFPAFANAANCIVTGNNLVAADSQVLLFGASGSTNGHTIDYNEYSSTETTPFLWAGVSMTFADWQQETGHDAHSSYRQALGSPQDFRGPVN